MSWDSSVGIVTAKTTGVLFPEGATYFCFSTPQRPDRLWDPLSLLSNGYQ
jgi:hypothetical protein